MSAHNHDEEIQKAMSGKRLSEMSPPDYPTDEDATLIKKDGHYIAERQSDDKDYWHVHLINPVTPELFSHLKQCDGIESATPLGRYSVLVNIARMYRSKAAEVIANAVESFKG